MVNKPGGFFLHPVYLGAIGVLVLNNFWLKQSGYAPWLAGKLSDVALMVFMPAVLCVWWVLGKVCWDLLMKAIRDSRAQENYFPPRMVVAASLLVSGLVMTLLQISSHVSSFYYQVLNPINQALWGWGIMPPTQDPSDILTCGFLVVPYLLFQQQRRLLAQ
tara:strand:- start:57 stop:539 length:483 start_codon:yes stop_codon:yes gene_type:complete